MKKENIKIGEDVIKITGIEKDDMRKKIMKLVREHKLFKSSFAEVSVINEEIIIGTSYGMIKTDSSLKKGTKVHRGSRIGFSPGKNNTGHKLPASGSVCSRHQR